MHARVTTISMQAANVAEATRIYQDSIVPVLRAANGFKGGYLLTDPASGKALSITLWASEADGQAYDGSGSYREQVAKVAQFFSAPPSLATYEVGVQA